jgi:Rieske 2Fe-2S family protein
MKRMIHKLPVEAYTSEDWFDQEQKTIFSKTWRYAGFREDLTKPGQSLTVQAGVTNIFIVMGRDRRLRAFHNICRHRGTQLIRATGKSQKVLTCPYHDWTYDLEGRLISVPEEESEFGVLDKACLGLKPASVDIWRGMLFVHPDVDAGPITNWFGDIEDKLGPHKVEDLSEYKKGAHSYEIKANWKIVVENYIDVYHLKHLHSGTLSMYDHTRAEYEFIGPHYVFKEPLSEDYKASLEKNAPMPLVVSKEDAAAWVPMLFPGVGLAESESSWATFIITPVTPSLTKIENRVRVAPASDWEFAKQSMNSNAFWSKKVKAKYHASSAHPDDPMASGDFTAEDVFACEQQQKSLQSPYLEIGPASIGEGPLLSHQQLVLDWLLSHE